MCQREGKPGKKEVSWQISVLTSLCNPCEPVQQFLQAGVIGQRAPWARQHRTHTGQQQRTLSVHGTNVCVLTNDHSGCPETWQLYTYNKAYIANVDSLICKYS